MNEDDLNKQAMEGVKKDTEMASLYLTMKTELHQFLLKTNCIVFGVIVALYQGNSTSVATRYSFAAAVVLLALSILLLGICLYAELYYLRRGRHLHAKEHQKAFVESRPVRYTSVASQPIFVVCEVGGYLCFAGALFALCGYVLCPIIGL